MTTAKTRAIPAARLLALLLPAQERLDLVEFAAVPAVTGNEQEILRKIAAEIPQGWQTRLDAFGSMVVSDRSIGPGLLS